MQSQQLIRDWGGCLIWVTMQVCRHQRTISIRRWVSRTKWVVRGQKMNKSIHRAQERCPLRVKERRVQRARNTWAMWRLLSSFRRRSYRSKSSRISRGNRKVEISLGISMTASLHYQNLEAMRGKSQRKVLLQVKKTSRIRALTSLVRRYWLPLLQRKRTIPTQ